jgi:ADP-ribose pyrophosphatase YjhB (NUDIX family)
MLVADPALGKYLGVSRKGQPTQFGLPGGKVEAGEHPAVAAMRELREETALIALRPMLVYVALEPNGSGYFTYTYMCSTTFGEIHTDVDVVAKWLTAKELTEGPFGDYNCGLFATLQIALE